MNQTQDKQLTNEPISKNSAVCESLAELTSESELVKIGDEMLDETRAIRADTQWLLEYADKEASLEKFIPDFSNMLKAVEQLSSLITQLFSKKNGHGELELETLTSAIRHDLRTPVNAIFGYGDMLAEDIEEEFEEETHPEARAKLQKTLASGQRLLTLIGELYAKK
jgi:adenylate cyclase